MKSKLGRPCKQSLMEKQGKGRWGGRREEGQSGGGREGRRNEGGRKGRKMHKEERREGGQGEEGGHVRCDMWLEPRKPRLTSEL